ncbi:MAG: NAD(P)H-hydrate dehydratase [Clostridia bacterium]|nr:NAD(P)H-hydrate dehydratase [Clostridia bacterium]MBQ3326377.1 NAD(P)H-hydrate dehydratase [Clostridia bacterium]MBQ3995732.1 NAD(P)H-hydrate dehydratase [Clostridia bacterium]MBQ5479917.1 NAD(P)H-hydrate dehydratase [Clostridia bacterium]MBQ5685426.1 NAD(P)H-hydrate dehydratase [Clostridia bacterium]
MIITTADEIRAIEVREDEIGTKFLALMEKAGSGCADLIMEEYAPDGGPVTVVCGSGKNGGDGFVIARKLLRAGYDVCAVLAFGEPKAADAVENFRRANDLAVPMFSWGAPEAEEAVKTAQVLVDCMFGIGFRGAANELQSEVFSAMNEAPGDTVSIDVPSGVVTDTGEVLGTAVKADRTIAISTLKPLHVLYPAREYCGEIRILDIGLLPASYEAVTPRLHTLDGEEAAALLPARSRTAHKNDAGHILSLCGSYRMPGAACLCANAALRAGAGLVTAAYPESAYPAVSSHLTEAMSLPLPAAEDGTLSVDSLPVLKAFLDRATVLVAGCGLGQSDDVRAVLTELLKTFEGPALLDADALNNLAGDLPVLKERTAPTVLTPHPGEMARLTGKPVSELLTDRVSAAKTFADEYGVTVLLKGPDTVIASCDSEEIFVNATGNEGLAKGGSGDTLSGILGALLAQGTAPFEAAAAAAYYHGKAAEYAALDRALRSILATDLIEALPFVLP